MDLEWRCPTCGDALGDDIEIIDKEDLAALENELAEFKKLYGDVKELLDAAKAKMVDNALTGGQTTSKAEDVLKRSSDIWGEMGQPDLMKDLVDRSVEKVLGKKDE